MKLILFPLILISMYASGQKTVNIEGFGANLQTTVYSEHLEETIILLHGGPGVPDDMEEVVEVLKSRFRVINFTQRGLGESICTSGDYSMQAYIWDIDSIASHFKCESFHLFGHSWGGLYAQVYAYSHPERIKSLFLCGPGSGTGATWKQMEKEVLAHNKSAVTTGGWLRMGWQSLMGLLGSDRAYQKLFRQVLVNYQKDYPEIKPELSLLNQVRAKAVNKTKKEAIKYHALQTWESPPFPILITYGDNDIYGESRKTVIERFPTAEVITIKNCGHIPWKQNLQSFNGILDHFYLKP